MPSIRSALVALMSLAILLPARAAGTPPTAPNLYSVWTSMIVGEQGQYAARDVVDPDSTLVTYTFDWGDGSAQTVVGPTDKKGTGQGVGPYHTWTSAGTFSVRAKVTDDQGNASAWSAPLNVVVGNPPSAPVLSSTWTTVGIGQQGQYAASGVRAPGATSITYTFDWGDGSTTNVGPMAVQATTQAHAWALAGTYTVRVLATDNLGRVSPWSLPLTVTVVDASLNAPTAPVLSSTSTALYTGQQGQYAARDVVAPGATSVTYTYDWGDGSTTNVGPTTQFGTGRGVSASHAWSLSGTYSVRARATNNVGAVSPWSQTILVTVTPNQPPVTPASPSGPTLRYTGQSGTFSAATSDLSALTLQYTFSWGDGTETRSSWVASGAVGSASHAWASAGAYSVKVKATDNYGLSSDWSAPITVNVLVNTPPTTPSAPSGQKVLGGGMVGTYTTAGSLDSTSSQVRYTFDFGDGTRLTTAWVAPGTPVGLKHMWSLPGGYAVKVMATDDGGLSSAWSAPFTVTITSKSVTGGGGGVVEAP